MCSPAGSILWLSQVIRPDVSTIAIPLSQHQTNHSFGYIRAAKYTSIYLKAGKTRYLFFSSKKNTNLEAYLNFSLQHNKILPLSNANWGYQDQLVPYLTIIKYVPQFTVRPMLGFSIYHNRPLTWMANHQKLIAQSSAEAEIYATDECIK